MGYRKPGRPAKHVGLATPDSLKKVVNGGDLRDLRETDPQPEGSVLSDPRPSDPPQAGALGVFGAADGDNRGRPTPALESPVLNSPGRADAEADLRLDALLRQIARETAAPLHQDRDTVMTNMEALARRVWNDALSNAMGSQRTREMLVERLEGKAVRGDKPVVQDTTIEEQLDRTEADLINSVGRDPK